MPFFGLLNKTSQTEYCTIPEVISYIKLIKVFFRPGLKKINKENVSEIFLGSAQGVQCGHWQELDAAGTETKSPGAHGKHLPGLVTFRPMFIRLTELWNNVTIQVESGNFVLHVSCQFAARLNVKSRTADVM
jgi:hypothetical protein